MYGIFSYIWFIFYGFHVGKYTSLMHAMGMVNNRDDPLDIGCVAR